MNNDLISRSELKREFAKFDRIYIADTKNELVNAFAVDKLIENAPTVETDIEVVAKDAYKQGYIDGWKERFGEPNERPQGEWEKCQNDMFRCSNCRQADEVPTAMGTPIYNFCPNCGADMRK